MQVNNYLECFQNDFVQIFQRFCVSLTECNVTPKLFLLSLPDFQEAAKNYSDNLNEFELNLFARSFYEYMLNDILNDSNTYKIYFNENGSSQMIKKQFELLWPKDVSLQEKQIAAFFDFAIALEFFLFHENENRDQFYNEMKDNEDKVIEMLSNIYNSLKSFFLVVFEKFMHKHLKITH